MIEETEILDFWDIESDFDAKLVTTNGIVKNNGELVMGAGIAKQFKERYPVLPRVFGDWVDFVDNVPCCYHLDEDDAIISMPTKYHFKDNSDLKLIEESAKRVVKIVNKWKFKSVLSTPPGCGMGRLKWEDVREVLQDIWDDRFTVIVPKG